MKNKKSKPVLKAQKTIKKILEFYYMTPEEITVKAMAEVIHCVSPEQVELWNELDLMEVVLTDDSLIFQNASECFIDPLDLEFIEQNQIKTMYQVSYAQSDEAAAKQVLKDIVNGTGGFICNDSEDFEPVYRGADMLKW